MSTPWPSTTTSPAMGWLCQGLVLMRGGYDEKAAAIGEDFFVDATRFPAAVVAGEHAHFIDPEIAFEQIEFFNSRVLVTRIACSSHHPHERGAITPPLVIEKNLQKQAR